ncbi:hypothetical protein FRC03_011594 [Tulasnella sp. 419]|nr:hypothetical protein FRC03_011594 [Tulasnella sp. 419]
MPSKPQIMASTASKQHLPPSTLAEDFLQQREGLQPMPHIRSSQHLHLTNEQTTANTLAACVNCTRQLIKTMEPSGLALVDMTRRLVRNRSICAYGRVHSTNGIPTSQAKPSEQEATFGMRFVTPSLRHCHSIRITHTLPLVPTSLCECGHYCNRIIVLTIVCIQWSDLLAQGCSGCPRLIFCQLHLRTWLAAVGGSNTTPWVLPSTPSPTPSPPNPSSTPRGLLGCTTVKVLD